MTAAENYAEAALAELVEAFPAAFTLVPALVRPLKLGIKNDIYAGSSMSHRRVTAALKRYCDSIHYLAACMEGAVRVDLSGAAAGVVTAMEAQYALAARGHGGVEPTSLQKDTLKAGKNVKGRTGATKESKAQAAISGPKRSSLADLRKAALARKGSRSS